MACSFQGMTVIGNVGGWIDSNKGKFPVGSFSGFLLSQTRLGGKGGPGAVTGAMSMCMGIKMNPKPPMLETRREKISIEKVDRKKIGKNSITLT